MVTISIRDAIGGYDLIVICRNRKRRTYNICLHIYTFVYTWADVKSGDGSHYNISHSSWYKIW